jgi:large subunit ribosomal protein L6
MARIAHKPIPLPPGVKISVDGRRLTAAGPKGTLTHELMPGLKAEASDKEFRVLIDEKARLEPRELSKRHGFTRTLLKNMVQGVTQGFEKKLEIRGIGYRAAVEKGKLVMSLGFSHPVELLLPKGITVDVDKQVFLTVKGMDKYQVGETAAVIRRTKPPEVYKGTGIRYLNEHVIQKVGKAGKVGAAGAGAAAAAK